MNTKKRRQEERRVGFLSPVLLLFVSSCLLLLGSTARASTPSAVEMLPSSEGHLGAWLVLGPFKSATNGVKGSRIDPLATPPPGVDEGKLVPSAAGTRWTIASSSDGPIDVRAALHASGGDLIAYAAGSLHLERAGRIYLL